MGSEMCIRDRNNPTPQEEKTVRRYSDNSVAHATTEFVATLPILATYQVSPKVSIEAGLVGAFHPGTISIGERLDESFSKPSDSKMNLGFALGMEQKLNRKMAINLRYNKNITSPTTITPDSNVMLSARYKF